VNPALHEVRELPMVRVVSSRPASLFSRSQTFRVDGPCENVARRLETRTVTAKASSENARDIPEATVARLPVYLRALVTLSDAGTGTCSS
jgi:hypothetical protein